MCDITVLPGNFEYTVESSKIRIITSHAGETCLLGIFAIWGKAMTYTYKQFGKVKHGL